MLTFQNLYEEAQSESGDSSSATTTLLKRAINQGAHLFRAALNREFITDRRTFSPTADQQFYQLPESAIRLKSITITVSNIAYPLQEIVSEQQWRLLNAQSTQTSDIPEFFYVRGSDEFGIWPTPSTTLASGGEIVYEARARDMSQDNYTTGTITATQDSASITGAGTTFTANMVGRLLKVDDGSPDGLWYKIASFTDTTHITLENVYEGDTGAGKTYIIGEVPSIPEEFHLALVDYALYRFYRRRKDPVLAKECKKDFDESVMVAKQTYAMKTSSQLIRRPVARNASVWTREPNVATGS